MREQNLPVSMAMHEVMEPSKIKILKKLTKFGKLVEDGRIDLEEVYTQAKQSTTRGFEEMEEVEVTKKDKWRLVLSYLHTNASVLDQLLAEALEDH